MMEHVPTIGAIQETTYWYIDRCMCCVVLARVCCSACVPARARARRMLFLLLRVYRLTVHVLFFQCVLYHFFTSTE